MAAWDLAPLSSFCPFLQRCPPCLSRHPCAKLQSADSGQPKAANPPRVSAHQKKGHQAASPRSISSARHLPQPASAAPGQASRSAGSFSTSANTLPLPTPGGDTAEIRVDCLKRLEAHHRRHHSPEGEQRTTKPSVGIPKNPRGNPLKVDEVDFRCEAVLELPRWIKLKLLS